MDMGCLLNKQPDKNRFLVRYNSVIQKTCKACCIILDVLVLREESAYKIKPISSPEWTQAVQMTVKTNKQKYSYPVRTVRK